jgi:hypothetical protein
MTTVTTQALLDDAHEAAESIVKGWIRKTFRETSLQCLRQQWKVSGDELEITPGMLQNCHHVCQRLAVNWEKRLREANQLQVERWVHEVAALGEFWQEGEQQEGETQTNEASRSTEPSDTTTEQEDTEPTEASDPHEVITGINDVKLPLAKLRHLYTNSTDLNMWQATLNSLGKSGDTQWPLDWKIIEDYCQQQLVPRLHARTPRVRFEVVPKDLAQGEDDDVVQSKRLKALLDKKRKATEDTPQQPTRRRRVEEEEPIEEARPPSDHPELVQWDWEALKETIDNKKQLETDFLHSETEPDPTHTILGALRTLGHTHFHLSGPDTTDMTDKQRRRALTTCVKQRLGGLEVIRDSRKTPTTKIVRAKSKEEHYMELDVGECLLELNGKLHAFSSLEISLKDEDPK